MIELRKEVAVRRRGWWSLSWILVLTAWAAGCGGEGESLESYRYTVPEQLDDGWPTGSLVEVDIEQEPIVEMFDGILSGRYRNIHSVLMIRHGRLVAEEYFRGTTAWGQDIDFQRNTLHAVYSVTKSVTSALVGIAMEKGEIRGLDARMLDLLPSYADLLSTGGKKAILLRHFLSMTGGLEWDEWTYSYTDSRNSHVQMQEADDAVRYVLEQPLVDPPGTVFTYNSGISIALGEALYSVTGRKADELTRLQLFEPMGISKVEWEIYSGGLVETGGGLSMRPRDMGKFGLLYLQDGVWNGQQLVPRDWVRESTKKQAPLWGYGYHWWVDSLDTGSGMVDSFSAQGYAGQFIFVVPDLDLVTVFTAGNVRLRLANQPYDMMRKHILPALQ